MTRFSRSTSRSRLATTLPVGFAVTALLVAVVWSTSSAADGDTPTDPVDTIAYEEPPTSDTSLDSVPTTSGDSNNETSDELAARVASLEETVAELRTLLDTARAALEEVGMKTSQLDATGSYAGPVNPRQISPQLKVSDIAGKWPFDRTEGDLPLSRVDTGLTSCRSDSRFYGVITVGSFRQLECVKIAK